MSFDSHTAWFKLDEIKSICAELDKMDDDALKMLALRISALSRSFQDSMLEEPANTGDRTYN